MSRWRAFWAGCWFGHERIRERGPKGQYFLVCQTCGDKRHVLKGQVLKVRRPAKVVEMAKRRKSA